MPDAQDSFVACTVASRRFLAQAQVLADSFFEHHPDGRFAVLVPDDPREERSLDARVEVLRPPDVGVEGLELHRQALAYSVRQLSCAMKVHLLRHLVQRGDVGVLLDGDVCIYSDLTPIADLARREGLVLSPHCTTPHGPPDVYPPKVGHADRRLNAYGPDQMMVQCGTFNTGILAAGPRDMDFLDWWRARVTRYCLLEPDRGLFQEQGWTTLAPTLFDCHVLREPGWNVNAFHLHDADVTWDSGRPEIHGAPLRTFHFITFDPHRPDRLSNLDHLAAVWPDLRDRPGAGRVCAEYAERLLAAGHDEALADVSPFDLLPDGSRIDDNMRAAYAEALLEHEAGQEPVPPNPFEDGDAERWLRWLGEPVPDASGGRPVSRYLWGLHARMHWVFAAFNEVPGQDGDRFLEWLLVAARNGHIEVPERWLPPEVPPPPDPALARLQQEYRDLLSTLQSHRGSRSWRLTAPLRRAAALMRR